MNQFCCTTTAKTVSGTFRMTYFTLLLLIEIEGGVVVLLEPPVSEEPTPLPSSHDVLAQGVRLQKALNRLGLVTQQVTIGYMRLHCTSEAIL